MNFSQYVKNKSPKDRILLKRGKHLNIFKVKDIPLDLYGNCLVIKTKPTLCDNVELVEILDFDISSLDYEPFLTRQEHLSQYFTGLHPRLPKGQIWVDYTTNCKANIDYWRAVNRLCKTKH